MSAPIIGAIETAAAEAKSAERRAELIRAKGEVEKFELNLSTLDAEHTVAKNKLYKKLFYAHKAPHFGKRAALFEKLNKLNKVKTFFYYVLYSDKFIKSCLNNYTTF